jgi:hypothetical protein
MSTLGFYQDAPYKIDNEGREITIKLQKTSPTSAKVTWTLPKGAPGCSIEDLAYNGIVIVADNVPIKLNQTPVNQTYYTGDATVDRNIHAGDRIGTGLVVGAMYDDKTTTSIELTGLTANTPIYVAGFAVNNVAGYHREGVHTYSQDYLETGINPNTPGCQMVQVGIQSTDSTGLDVSKTYKFQIVIDGATHSISIDGSEAQTYQQLIDVLNETFATLNITFRGSNPPNYGKLYVDRVTPEAYAWNGYNNVPLDTIFSNTTPTTPSAGDFWVNTTTNTLNMWNGSSWIVQLAIRFDNDPLTPKCDTYWFDGVNGYKWDGMVWVPTTTYNQPNDPSTAPTLPCGSYWLNSNTNTLYFWKTSEGSCTVGELVVGEWVQTEALVLDYDPRLMLDGSYWYNTTINKLMKRAFGLWENVTANVVTSTSIIPPTASGIGSYWYNPSNETLFQWDSIAWIEITNDMVVWKEDPTTPSAGDLLFRNNALYVWDQVTVQWKLITSFFDSQTNPALATTVLSSSLWYNGSVVYEWDGMQWINACVIQYTAEPTTVPVGTFWYNSATNEWKKRGLVGWTLVDYVEYPSMPSIVAVGQYWYNHSSNSLFVWNGIAWNPLIFQTQPIINTDGELWYNTTNKTLYQWKGGTWVTEPTTYVMIDENGHLIFKSGSTGSKSSINITDDLSTLGLYKSLIPSGRIQPPTVGSDALLQTPSYLQLGVGTDGSSEERREMAEAILLQLGYPTVQVELTKQQLEFCIDQGLQTLRRMGSSGYERVYFFLNLRAGQQTYSLTDQTVGFHKIVSVMGIHRMTSAFLGSAEGQGVYGQIVLQHLYSMGTFDLVSYHIINEYIELMEKMFAANIMYTWREKPRLLSIQQNLWRDERVLVDATIERTEQDILADRYLNNWIQTWATSEACQMLAEIRGKFSTLPGAGGGITLNASDLRQRAESGFAKCIQELDDYIANSNVEDLGMGCTFIMG